MSEHEPTAVRLLVSGRVQGVGFRWFVQRRSTALGLVGVVRNLADGRVEIVAAGPAAALSELERAVERGPTWATVSHVEKGSTPLEMTDYKTFSIN